ncbi:hypothetical protein ZOD2009_15186 [Haladaptatus paucihalophilus DX253]|uniref:DUF354 domain-containing protein n=1 Tax=Haladaptatus paucihalophilus DX253 TaxID=797209 RepID=E7QW49_HALPU|nr:DUF354 domain-containing protein [Haladaptatus paucihalophilus]EFW91183.1 hypothetical protein ZOD2009_15186 [Haladaptatus paucihalophilus DX253]SHL64576.1 hypothetical protein SAMN05444342_4311 [Haladaptatus paucihalophilus DX253]
MKVFVTIQHPAHVHFFRNAIAELEADDHDVHVFAREKEMAVELLRRYDISHEVLAGTASGLSQLARVQATYEARLLRRAVQLKPDVITAIGGVAAAHVAKVTGARSAIFYDTEHAKLIQNLAFPFADAVYTPDCYTRNVGSKQVRYPGYHELAYLHPDRFTPDPTVVEDLGLDPDETFTVLRLVEWGASHDVGQGGFDDVHDVVERLEDAGSEVLITSERTLPSSLESRRATVPPHRMHDLLAFADLFVGEGATMAAESAVLGTPAIYVNTLTMGYTDELDERYELLFNYQQEDRHARALEQAVSILEGDADWQERRQRLLDDKVDTTDVILRAITGRSGNARGRTAQTGAEV